jgi:hypothetical protein
MTEVYQKLVLDPKCLKPAALDHIYVTAVSAINDAIDSAHITESEKKILNAVKYEVRKNRFY